MSIPNGDILTNLLKDFTVVTANASARTEIQGYAMKVYITLITIDVIIVCIYGLIDDQNHPIAQTLLKRTLKYGGFAFMVLYFKDIVNEFLASFTQIGLIAGGKTLSVNDFTNPSYISTLGMDMIGPFVQNIIDGKSSTGGGVIDMIKSLPSMILLGFVYLMILACFFAIAINIFIVYIEFAIFTSVALILVPFGVWDKTEFIYEKAKNGVINYCIKYMTLAVIISIAMTKIKDWQLPPDPTFQQSLYVLLGMLAITYLSWHAPTVAAGFAGGHGGTMTGAAVGGFAGSSIRNTGTILGGTGAVAGATAGVAGAAAKTGASMAHKGMLKISPNVYGGLADKVSTAADQLKSGFKQKSTQSDTTAPLNPSGVNLSDHKPNTTPTDLQ